MPDDPAEERERILRNLRTEDSISPEWPNEGQSDVTNALDRVPVRLVERILGALELTVAGVILDPPPPETALAELAGPPRPGDEFAMVTYSSESEARSALSWIDLMRPGATPLVEALSRALADRPEVAAHLQVGPEVSEEEAILARQGAAYLAWRRSRPRPFCGPRTPKDDRTPPAWSE